ncbi:MAG: DUF1775 domain-containing protein [Halobacteria archaeon]
MKSIRALPPLLGLGIIAVLQAPVLGHAVVSPAESVTDRFETYLLRVPTEEPVPTVEVTLEVPHEVEVKRVLKQPGWTVVTEPRHGEGTHEKGEHAHPGEVALARVTWRGNTIAPGEFEEFKFSGRNGAKPVTVSWRVHQRYQDGKVVSWTGAPGSETPASQTWLVERPRLEVNLSAVQAGLSQLQQSYSQVSTANAQALQTASAASGPAYAAIALAAVALLVAAVPLLRKKP